MEAENDKQTNLRKKIAEIKLQNQPKEQEAKLIQGQFYKSKSKNDNQQSEKNNFTEQEQQKTYFCQEDNKFGCEHYHRNAKILAECCKKLYPCRLCHDEYASHNIDRFSTKFMMCMSCDKNELQEIGQECKYCLVKISEYYCDVCKQLSSDINKPLYHCDKCGICRVGDIENAFHCDLCEACYDIQAKDEHNKETCVSSRVNSTCPCCHEETYGSVKRIFIIKCGHCFHEDCQKKMFNAEEYRCPICKKSIPNMDMHWAAINSYMDLNKMPEEYKDWESYVQCNDCELKFWTKFHFAYHKCDTCNGYNTCVLEKKIPGDIKFNDEVVS